MTDRGEDGFGSTGVKRAKLDLEGEVHPVIIENKMDDTKGTEETVTAVVTNEETATLTSATKDTPVPVEKENEEEMVQVE